MHSMWVIAQKSEGTSGKELFTTFTTMLVGVSSGTLGKYTVAWPKTDLARPEVRNVEETIRPLVSGEGCCQWTRS